MKRQQSFLYQCGYFGFCLLLEYLSKKWKENIILENKLISATKLYEVMSMLMTDTVRENAVASNLLHQVLLDIQNAPAIYMNQEFESWLRSRINDSKAAWHEADDEMLFGEYKAYEDVLSYLRYHEVIR